MKNRLDHYTQETLLKTFITTSDDEEYFFFQDERTNVEPKNLKEDNNIYEIIKEMIFDIEDDKPVIHLIFYAFNSIEGSLSLAHLMHTAGENEKDIYDSILETIAMGIIYDIPIYPNNKEVENELVNFYLELFENGFVLEDEKGETAKYKLTSNILPNYSSDIKKLVSSLTNRTYSFTEIKIIQ